MNNYLRFCTSKAISACFLIIFFLLLSSKIKAQITVSVKDTIPTCVGANFKITATSNVTAGAIFSWTGPNGFTSNQQDASISNLQKNGLGVYTVTVVQGGQSASATTIVKENAIEVAVIGGYLILCVGENLRLRDIVFREPKDQPLSYFWTGPDNFTSTASRIEIPTTEDLRQLGEYSLAETYENGCVVVTKLTPNISKCQSIGNLVWNDTNNDGLNNNGELGVGNVTVRLFKAKIEGGIPTDFPDGVAIQTTTTNTITGKYLFPDLVPGAYIVEIDAPNGYISSIGINGSTTGIYEPAGDANADINDDDDGTLILGKTIRTTYILLENYTEPQNDGDTTIGTNADKNSNLTIDFGLYKSECPTEPKCNPMVVRKGN
jgi:hypothetical protein